MLLILFISVCSLVSPYNILVYNSKFGHSHSNFLGNIADILVDAGHDVTSLIPIIDPETKDGTKKSNKIYVTQAEKTRELLAAMTSTEADFFSMSSFDPLVPHAINKPFAMQYVHQCEALLDSKEVLKTHRADKYDVMIVENFDMCGVAYSHLIKPKSLITSSSSAPLSYMQEEFGLPLSLSYNPSSYMSSFNVHSIIDRIRNIYANYLMHVMFEPGRYMIDDLFKARFGKDYPGVQEISSNAAYTLTNTEPLIDFAVPTLARVVQIGGIGAKAPAPLSEYWNAILSRRSKTVLISFGSAVLAINLPDSVKRSILSTISRFPNVTFIWKFEQPDSEFAKEALATHENLVLTSWMPQNDLLADDRISAFVTHGGMGSTQETALRGKPAIFIPVFGDQPRNALMMQHNGFGKVLYKEEVNNPDIFVERIRDVLENESYRQNAAKIRAMLAKKPFSAKELLIKTVEFAAEFGPSKALRPQSYDMSFVEYHNLDITSMFIVLAVISLYFTGKLFLWVFVFSHKNKTKQE